MAGYMGAQNETYVERRAHAISPTRKPRQAILLYCCTIRYVVSQWHWSASNMQVLLETQECLSRALRFFQMIALL